MRSQVADRMLCIVREVFDKEDLLYDDLLAVGKIEAWDNLGLIRVLRAVEKEFGMHFTSGDVDAVKNAGDMLEIVMQRRSGQ